jgi:hypothetical protein
VIWKLEVGCFPIWYQAVMLSTLCHEYGKRKQTFGEPFPEKKDCNVTGKVAKEVSIDGKRTWSSSHGQRGTMEVSVVFPEVPECLI